MVDEIGNELVFTCVELEQKRNNEAKIKDKQKKFSLYLLMGIIFKLQINIAPPTLGDEVWFSHFCD